VVRSAFVEALGDHVELVEEEIACSRLVTPGARLAAAEGLARAPRLARIEWDREQSDLSAYAGLIESADLKAHVAELRNENYLWSPTQLEAYAKCPWAYFSGRLLKLDRLEDPDEEMDAATRGGLLHDALSRFFGHATERIASPVLLLPEHRAWVLPLAEQSLDETLAEARGHKWLGSELLLGPKRLELRRILLGYLEWELEQNGKLMSGGRTARRIRTGVVAHEEALGEVEFERDGVRIRFRGFVDRVEIGVDERFDSARYVAAIDYKTTVWSCPGSGKGAAWDDGVVLQVPLYAWALAKTRPGSMPVRVEYRALKRPKPVHSLELFTFNGQLRSAVRDGDAFAKMDGALDAVVGHVRRARGGEFPVRPAESCGCPSFCHALEICRVAGGPKTGDW
jgi:ATP-dependent helicase/nuclease subunit B